MYLEKTFRHIDDILRNAKWRVSYRLKKKGRTYMDTLFWALHGYKLISTSPRASYTKEKPLEERYSLKLRFSEHKHLVEAIGYIEWEIPEDAQTEAMVLYYLNYRNLILKGVKLILNNKTRKVEAKGTSNAKDFGPSEALFYAAYFQAGNILLKTSDDILYNIQKSEVLSKDDIYKIVTIK